VPGILSRYDVAIADAWGAPGTEFPTGGIDKLDLQVVGNGDALVQFLVGGTWEPAAGMIVGRGLFRSIPGLSLLFPPTGPTGVRFRRRTAGVGATVNFDAFML